MHHFEAVPEITEADQIAIIQAIMSGEEAPLDRSVYTFLICRQGYTLIAMARLYNRLSPAFLAGAAGLADQLPPYRAACELRPPIFVVEPPLDEVTRGLVELAVTTCRARDHDLLITHVPADAIDLWRALGFTPLAAPHQAGGAPEHTMYRMLEPVAPPPPAGEPLSFMPGPVSLPAAVRTAFCADPVSHRADQFMQDVQRLKATLCERVNARHVELLFGSATLANEALAAQLTQLHQRGIMLSNGEFGSRLIEQARCWQLDIEAYASEWGEPFDYAALEDRLARNGDNADGNDGNDGNDENDIGWLWFTHCETSTGMLNDLPRLKALCARYDVRCCVDCISSIGAVPIDLDGVYLATGASGKALGSYAGLGMVFYNQPIAPSPAIPRYLDIGYYAARNGVPFTLMSNLIYALAAALQIFDAGYYVKVARLAQQMRHALAATGLRLVAADSSIPTVTTLALPPQVNSVALGNALLAAGYELSYKSRYLVERNWIQICLMGEHPPQTVRALISEFHAQAKRLSAGQQGGIAS